MIKQPIALIDRLDGFGNSHYSFNSEKVFSRVDSLTTLRTFRLRGSIGHCEFTSGLLTFFSSDNNQWILFKKFDALQQYIFATNRGNAVFENENAIKLREENVRELCETAEDFGDLRRLCGGAPYILVQLENILQNNKIGIFGVEADKTNIAMEQLRCVKKEVKKTSIKRKFEKSDEDVDDKKRLKRLASDDIKLSTSDEVVDDDDASPLQISLEISNNEIVEPEVQVFGVNVTVFANNESFKKLHNEETSLENVRTKILNHLDADENNNQHANDQKSTKGNESERCNLALSVLFESMAPLGATVRTESHQRVIKLFNLDYQPPLVEHSPLFPALSSEHGMRFELYDYQRRLLYWMLMRERQSLLFQAWPAHSLRNETKLLDELTISEKIYVPTGTSLDHNQGFMIPNGYLTFPKSGGVRRAEIIRSSDETLVKFCNNVFPQITTSSHCPKRIRYMCEVLFGIGRPSTIGTFVTNGFQNALEIDELAEEQDDKKTNGIVIDGNICKCSKEGLKASQSGTLYCAGNCKAMEKQRDDFGEAFSFETKQCTMTLLAEAMLRAAQVQNFIDRQSHKRFPTKQMLVSNPQLFRVGVSCGQTGCGKTTMKIVLMYTMKRWEDAVPDTLRDHVSGQQSTSFEALLPSHRRPLMLSDNFATSSLKLHRRALYYANCTLVVCPEQVVEQWFMEFVKTIGCGTARHRPKTGKSRSVANGGVFGEIVDDENNILLNIAVVRDINALRLLTIVDIMERIDVLIVNQNLFKSESYRSNKKVPMNVEFVRSWNRLNSKQIEDRIFEKPGDVDWIAGAVAFEREYIQKQETSLQERMLREGKQDFDYDSIPKPGFAIGRTLLHAVHFRRKIIDEAHLLSAHVTAVERGIGELNSDMTWALTATANFDVAGAMRRQHVRNEGGYGKLLRIPDEMDRIILESNREYRCQFVNHCSATTSYDALPPLKLHRVPVVLTPAESAIYSSLHSGVKHKMLRLLFCSHHMLNNAAWMEKHLSRFLSEDDPNPSKTTKQVASPMMTVQQVAESMQSRRLEEIMSINDSLLEKIEYFRTAWLSLCESVTPKQLVKEAALEVDADIVAEEERKKEAEESAMAIDPLNDEELEQNQNEPPNLPESKASVKLNTLTHDYLGKITTEMLDRWKNERDIRVAMAVSRLEESATKAAISIRARYSNAVIHRTPMLSKRDRTLAEFNFFRNIFQRLSRPEESIECPICLSDDHTKESIVLTVCGHEFCTECSKSVFKKSSKCSVCRHDLTIPRDLRLVDRTPAPVLSPSPPPSLVAAEKKGEAILDCAVIRDSYGSKLAALITLINQILRRRDCKKIVIFAQFQRLLLLIADVLEKSGIKFVVVRGSIRSCEKAFRSFRYDSTVRIILLASDKSISGVHLVEANHLIAVHPMLCSRGVEDEYAMLAQAIGRIRRLMQRSVCHVWQLVTQNTIEEQLYDAQTAVARQKQAMDVGITWDATDTEEKADEPIDLTVTPPKKEKVLRKNLLRILGGDGNVEEEEEEGGEEEEAEEEAAVLSAEEINGDTTTEEISTENEEDKAEVAPDEEFGEWLCAQKYRKNKK